MEHDVINENRNILAHNTSIEKTIMQQTYPARQRIVCCCRACFLWPILKLYIMMQMLSPPADDSCACQPNTAEAKET